MSLFTVHSDKLCSEAHTHTDIEFREYGTNSIKQTADRGAFTVCRPVGPERKDSLQLRLCEYSIRPWKGNVEHAKIAPFIVFLPYMWSQWAQKSNVCFYFKHPVIKGWGLYWSAWNCEFSRSHRDLLRLTRTGPGGAVLADESWQWCKSSQWC